MVVSNQLSAFRYKFLKPSAKNKFCHFDPDHAYRRAGLSGEKSFIFHKISHSLRSFEMTFQMFLLANCPLRLVEDEAS